MTFRGGKNETYVRPSREGENGKWKISLRGARGGQHMSIHDVSGVVGWCLGAYSEVENTYVHHLHTFLHTGSGLYNPLQHPQCVSRPHILYNISTTLYNTLQSTALQQFYSLQPLQHPSASCCTSRCGAAGEAQQRLKLS